MKNDLNQFWDIVQMCTILIFYDVHWVEDGHPKSPGLPRRRSVVEDAAEARPAVVGPGCGRELALKLENSWLWKQEHMGFKLKPLNFLGVETGESAVLNPIKMGTGHQYHQSARMKDLNSKNKGFNQQRRRRFNQPEPRSYINIIYIFIYIYHNLIIFSIYIHCSVYYTL